MSSEGVFNTRTANFLRAGGWWLLLGSLLAALGEAGAHAALLATLARDYTFNTEIGMGFWQPPYALILTAIGLLTFAAIMRTGVAMQEDLEGPV